MKISMETKGSMANFDVKAQDISNSLQSVIKLAVEEGQRYGAAIIKQQVNLSQSYINEQLNKFPPTGTSLTGRIMARHPTGRPTTIRAGTYNPTFHGHRAGVTFNVKAGKSAISHPKWFAIKLKNSGYTVAAYHFGEQKVAISKKTGRPIKKRQLKVVYAPSVNQVFWTVAQDPKYEEHLANFMFTELNKLNLPEMILNG